MLDNTHFLELHWVGWVVIIAVLLWIFFTPNHTNNHRTKKSAQLDKLKKKLEKGQISEEEYVEQKQLLEKN